jgi:dTDP-4-amino-4,6-dideoxygalactose transaminase
MVLDYGPGDLLRLVLGGGDEQADLDAIDLHLARGRPFALTLSVRTAFDLLLSCIDASPGDEVVLSGITIPSMAEIAHERGMTVRVADVDPQTVGVTREGLGRQISDRTRLFVYAPILGSHCDLGELAALCREKNVLLVEDAAQAWDGVYRGSPHADVVFFSFGPAKTATALGGAVSLFRDGRLAELFRERERGYPAQSRAWLLRRVAKFAAFLPLRSPLTFGAAERLVSLVGVDTDAAAGGLVRGFPKQGLISRIRHRLPPPIRHLIAHKLGCHTGARARKQRAEYLVGQLDRTVRVPGRLAEHMSFWLTAVSVQRPEELVRRLRAAGYDATQGASNLAAVVDDPEGEAPSQAAAMMSSIVYLPLSRYTRTRQLDEMAAIVNEFVREAARSPF